MQKKSRAALVGDIKEEEKSLKRLPDNYMAIRRANALKESEKFSNEPVVVGEERGRKN